LKQLIRAAKEARKCKWLLFVSMISTVCLTVINLIAPQLISGVTKDITGESEFSIKTIQNTAIILLSLYLLRILFRFLNSYMSHLAAWRLVFDMRVKIYDKFQALSMDFFRNTQSGDLVSRSINDTGQFEMLYAHILPDSITNVLTAVGVTAILFMTNAKLALFTCIPIPFVFFAGKIFTKKIRPNFRVAQKYQGLLSAQLQDNFSGMQEIQTFGQQEKAMAKVKEKAATWKDAILRALKMSAIFHPTVEFLTSIGNVVVVGFGGYLAYLNQLEVSEMVEFLLYLSLFYAPVTSLANLLEQMNQALAAVERVSEILDTPETVSNSENAIAIDYKNIKGEITFYNVSFSYNEGTPVLKNISFTVKPGKSVAVVGATGVGKSTLAQLIMRFYDPTEGVVKLDGYDIKQLEITSLRKTMAMVLQDTFLFNGTIAENIAFARPDATMTEIESAARISGVHDDILRLPNGYETIVGERGAKLSGGQKQRVAIARAIICSAPILILDEATASVDVRTEAGIQAALTELAGTRTVITIAHRLSTIKNSDEILVFKDGKIIQGGTHEQLIAVQGLYKEMYELQENA
jgi:ATP-binding cassette subfamily B protein